MNCMEMNNLNSVPKLGKPCWEEHQCGRETAGVNSQELGVCPAYKMDLGDGCWIAYGTMCGGIPREDYKEKVKRCRTCSTFLQYDFEHKEFMLKEWIDFEDPKDKDENKKVYPFYPPRAWRNRDGNRMMATSHDDLIASSGLGW